MTKKEVVKGFYYLHSESKDLICKRFMPESDSPFVTKVWAFSSDNRFNAWNICIQGLLFGAKVDRVKELAEKWQLIPEDSLDYMARMEPTPLLKVTLLNFMQKVHGLNEEEFWTIVTAEAEKRDSNTLT